MAVITPLPAIEATRSFKELGHDDPFGSKAMVPRGLSSGLKGLSGLALRVPRGRQELRLTDSVRMQSLSSRTGFFQKISMAVLRQPFEPCSVPFDANSSIQRGAGAWLWNRRDTQLLTFVHASELVTDTDSRLRGNRCTSRLGQFGSVTWDTFVMLRFRRCTVRPCNRSGQAVAC